MASPLTSTKLMAVPSAEPTGPIHMASGMLIITFPTAITLYTIAMNRCLLTALDLHSKVLDQEISPGTISSSATG